jgi:Ni,Fe-hydrogenase III large subunit
MLERERLANHLGDIGAICNDAAFAFFNYQFSRLREHVLMTNAKVFSNRLLMDIIVPGGVLRDISAADKALIIEEKNSISLEFERLADIYIDNPSLGNRVFGAGILSEENALELGCVGIVARASNIALDARVTMPYPPYERLVPEVITADSGDVQGRIMVRIGEVRESLRLLGRIIEEMPEGDISIPFSAPKPGKKGISIIEGWRGEIVCWVQTGPKGEINRCMVRDPSAVNWLALESAIKGNLVPDFPLCNKSFNQSYSGHDL